MSGVFLAVAPYKYMGGYEGKVIKKSQKTAFFFFEDNSFCNTQIAIGYVYVFFFVDPCREFTLGERIANWSLLEVKTRVNLRGQSRVFG